MKTIHKILIALVITTAIIIYLVSQLSTREGQFLILGSKTFSNNSECSMVASAVTSSTPFTVTCDAYHTDANIYEATPIDSAVLAIRLAVASTTDDNLTITLDYSHDGSVWYKDNLVSDEAMASTTTITNSATTTTNYLFNVLTPTRYIRATFSNSGGTISTTTAQFIPQKEVNK